MEETQLLFFIVVFAYLTSITNVQALSDLDFKQPTEQDINFAKELYGNALKILTNDSKITGLDNSKHNFYIFISLGMDKENIKNIAEIASKYKGTLVLRGFKDNSFIKTASFAKEITDQNNNIGFIIDPTLFKKYQINQVPSFVLAKEQICPPNTSCLNIFDKLVGNVMPDFALKIFSKSGDLKDEAERLLKK